MPKILITNKMRRLIVFVFLTVMVGFLQAQIISQQNTFRQFDQLNGKQIVCPQLMVTGTGLVWDISQREEVSDEDYTVEYYGLVDESDTLIAAEEQDTRYKYGMKGDSVLIRGFENRTTLMDYDIPEAWLKFPLHHGDSIEGYFHGVGRYCDRLGMRHYGRYKTKAGGMGDLVVAEGDTLKNVICLHTERLMSAEMMPIELLDSLVAYTQDNIDQHMVADTMLIRMDICRWYAEGYRYPVLETRMRRDGGGEQVLSEATYYFPPSAQTTISNDPDNEEVRAGSRAERIWGQTIGETADQKSDWTVGESGIMNEDPSEGLKNVFNLYGVDGKRISKGQTTRNGVYLHEQRQTDRQSTNKTIIKK